MHICFTTYFRFPSHAHQELYYFFLLIFTTNAHPSFPPTPSFQASSRPGIINPSTTTHIACWSSLLTHTNHYTPILVSCCADCPSSIGALSVYPTGLHVASFTGCRGAARALLVFDIDTAIFCLPSLQRYVPPSCPSAHAHMYLTSMYASMAQ